MAKKTDKTEDATTLALIAEVQRRKKELAAIERPTTAKTNHLFSYVENTSTNTVNLHVAQVPVLLKALGFLILQEEGFHRAMAAVGLVDPAMAFTWNGYTLADWMHDIGHRIDVLQLETKKKALDALQKRLDDVITPDLKRKMELEAIQEALR